MEKEHPVSQVLQSDDRLLRHGIDASHNGILIINRDGTILVYNKAARRIFNDREDSYVGWQISDVRPGAWRDLQEIIATGIAQIGKKIVLPEATIIANRSPVVEKGKVIGVISVFQDVSEHEKIISQLQNYQRLHRELEAIFDSSYDGFYITDGEANTIRVNKSYERITGLSRDALLGRNMRTLVANHIFDHSVTLEVLEKKKPMTLMQKIKGGKQVIVTGTPVFTDDGQISTVVTNVRDISELNDLRARLDETLRRSSFFYEFLEEFQEAEHVLQDLVVKSPEMKKVVQRAIKVARAEASVLLSGESGVGKSMLAKLIHKMSPRKEQPFVKINCGAIPESLMESELFGYEKGAFTGALSTGKIGLIEAANKGTLFFDEIAELKPEMQVRLLEVLEEKQFKRVGSTETVSVDVHIIAATNRQLDERIKAGLFREDLYYRLNVVPIVIPPLRERLEDIPSLTQSILEKYNSAHAEEKNIDPATLEEMRQYSYPGNVRELVNTIERMIVLSEGPVLQPTDLPQEIRSSRQMGTDFMRQPQPLKTALDNYEKMLLSNVLQNVSSMAEAARLLKIHPTTLWRKLTRHGLLVEPDSK